MSSGSPAARHSAPRTRQYRLLIWRIVGLTIALFLLEQNLQGLLRFAGMQQARGEMGTYSIMTAEPSFGEGFALVKGVIPGKPLAKAGVVDGDHLRFDHPSDYYRPHAVGERIGFIHDHRGRRSHKTITVVEVHNDARQAAAVPFILLNIAADCILVLFGGFVIWRGQSRSTMLLGIGLIGLGMTLTNAQFWESGRSTFLFFEFLIQSIRVLWFLSIPAFAMYFYDENVASISPRAWKLFQIYAGISGVLGGVNFYAKWNVTTLPVIGGGTLSMLMVIGTGFAAGLAYLIVGWRRSVADVQKRYLLLLTALSLVILSYAIIATIYLALNNQALFSTPFAWFALLLKGVIAPTLFAYAIFRDKVFDLGFALNRTLIFGTISFVVLVAFGLTEWAAKKLIPSGNLQTSAILNALVALAIFLVFHRIHHFVEHTIERFLFRSWHENEASLRKFVREAAFIAKPEALLSASRDAFGQFAGEATSTIYLRDGEVYRRHGAKNTIDSDDPAVVSLRSNHKPLELDGLHEANLALPFTHRGQLDGFVLLGPKPEGDDYRPDEIELLGWAAHQIGLDLHALRVAELERRVTGLETRNAELRAVLSARGAKVA